MNQMEMQRQVVHLSGLLFVMLAQYVGGLLSALYFLIIAATLFLYSEYIRRQQKVLWGVVDRMESKFREFAINFERKDVRRPFTGAIWFYAGCGLTFLLFPLSIASAACAMLAVGDALSTLIGINFGRHKILKKKSMEGSIAMFVGSFIVSVFFVNFYIGLTGAVIATVAELVPDLSTFKNMRKRYLIDDNYLVPLLSGLSMALLL